MEPVEGIIVAREAGGSILFHTATPIKFDNIEEFNFFLQHLLEEFAVTTSEIEKNYALEVVDQWASLIEEIEPGPKK
jgi:hypothetical protein